MKAEFRVRVKTPGQTSGSVSLDKPVVTLTPYSVTPLGGKRVRD
jgi:hypothetical protein